jgi:Rps23 Pro-64 3,4-dihydroxylase Tpa1-like proline 4-hydroxylase
MGFIKYLGNEEENMGTKRVHIDTIFRRWSEDILDRVGAAFTAGNTLENDMDHVQVYSKPFPHVILHHVMKDDILLHQARKELEQAMKHEKSNDLYQFTQTAALGDFTLKENALAAVSQALYSQEWVTYLRKMSRLALDERPIDVAGQYYRRTDHLLCHDDKLEGRRVAFILYLVDEDWNEEDGGQLELFSIDEYGQPKDIIRRIVPRWNTLVFFEVTPISYHQVAEVRSKTKQRISLSGWLHGPSSSIKKMTLEDCYQQSEQAYWNTLCVTKNGNMPCDITSYIEEVYISMLSKVSIRERFVQYSSACLESWMKPSYVKGLRDDLMAARWIHVGPANRRHYDRCDMSDECVGKWLCKMKDFWCSSEFLSWLGDITGLQLEPFTYELRRYRHGDYTLMADHNNNARQQEKMIAKEETYVLDVIFSIYDQDQVIWETSNTGGQWIYVDGEEILLTIWPKENTLSLIYREEDTMCFVKYINQNAEHTSRFDFVSSYKEQRMSCFS